ncbi:MAG: flagellar protein FlbD [Deltaproteobacteria bacterium]|nr:MAG: flagellar protein FlbD [Deltaproteobacteria bacterium]
MIPLTRINGNPVVINTDLVTSIEEQPDTVLVLINGDRIMVKESPEEIIDRLVEFRRKIHCPDYHPPVHEQVKES